MEEDEEGKIFTRDRRCFNIPTLKKNIKQIQFDLLEEREKKFAHIK